VTIFDYYLTLGSILSFLLCPNSLALKMVIIGLSIQPVCVNLVLLGERPPAKPYCYNP
jgi:hypothetical protein